jgi:hypothetical protein
MKTIRKMVNWLAGVNTWKDIGMQPHEDTKTVNGIEGGKTLSNLFALAAGEFDFILEFWEAGLCFGPTG